MMSILKKKPRHEVISIRLSEDRLKLLERYQKVLSEQRGREVSLGEAAFLVIEERVEGMDRETARHEMLSTPTASLLQTRRCRRPGRGPNRCGWRSRGYGSLGQQRPSSIVRGRRRHQAAPHRLLSGTPLYPLPYSDCHVLYRTAMHTRFAGLKTDYTASLSKPGR